MKEDVTDEANLWLHSTVIGQFGLLLALAGQVMIPQSIYELAMSFLSSIHDFKRHCPQL